MTFSLTYLMEVLNNTVKRCQSITWQVITKLRSYSKKSLTQHHLVLSINFSIQFKSIFANDFAYTFMEYSSNDALIHIFLI